MPIRAFITDGAAFDPEAIAAMSEAFEAACRELKVDGDDRAREAIAVRIVDWARQGEVDAAKLAERVLKEVGASI